MESVTALRPPLGPRREARILEWRPYEKNTLRGFFSVRLASGLILHSLMLHERNERRWIGYPSREWTNPEGEKQYTPIVEFEDPGTANRFRDEMLAALDRHFAQTQ